MIDFSQASKSLGGVRILDEVTLRIPEGKRVALLGLSGSGKTTLIKLVCGLHFADSGSVALAGTLVAPATLSEIRRSIGYVIQDGGLYPHLTARENITLAAEEQALPRDFVAARIRELAGLTQVSLELLEKRPGQLSGGQRQRVGLMRALFLDPPVLLMDEPLGALDPITRFDLQQELRDLFTRLKKTVLIVTHDLPEAKFLAEELVLLHQGRVVQAGPFDEFRRSPATPFVSRFLQAQRGL